MNNDKSENHLIINKKIGYARISADDQDLTRQILILKENGVRDDDIYKDYISGSIKQRPMLDAALNALVKGDIFMVLDIDRLSRDTIHGLEIITNIASKGCYFKSINEGSFNIMNEDDKLKITLYLALSEHERKKLRRRQNEAWSRGKQCGAPLSYEFVNGVFKLKDKSKQNKLEAAIQLYRKGFSIKEITNAVNISVHTLYKWLNHSKIKLERILTKRKK